MKQPIDPAYYEILGAFVLIPTALFGALQLAIWTVENFF